MSTRSSVSIKNADGSVTGIYVHSDGYIKNGVGEVLTLGYTTEAEVKELIMLGGCSWITPTEAFAYHRDRKEEWEHNQPIVADDFKGLQERLSQEYDYLFDNGVWYVAEVYNGNTLKRVDSFL